MSRGIGTIQKTILDLLTGKRPAQVYRNATAGLCTAEILAELIESQKIKENAKRKQQMNTVIRACSSLCRRGLLEGRYMYDCDNPGRITVQWSIIPKDKPYTQESDPSPG